MFLDKIPKIFFNAWLWIAIAGVLIALRYFFGKPAPPRKPSEFFLKHKKSIRRISDGFLILILTLDWGFIIYMSINSILLAYKDLPADYPPPPHTARLGLSVFLIMSIQSWAFSAIIIGMLSTFYLNLTKFKRLILLVISLVPVPLTILLLAVMPPEKPEEMQKTIMYGLWALITCWFVNGPAIIAGKHFLRVAWYISRALRFTSGDYPDWYE